MVGMTPWGVFFLACKLPYTKCWLLCQQAHLVTYLNLCLQVVFLTCEIYIGLYNLFNFNVAISIILIVEFMIDVVIGLKLFHNQSI